MPGITKTDFTHVTDKYCGAHWLIHCDLFCFERGECYFKHVKEPPADSLQNKRLM